MTTHKLMLLIAALLYAGTAFSQNNETPKTVPVYWTFELGTSFLTSTETVQNQPSMHEKTSSGSWYFYYDLPIGSKRKQKLSHGFSIAPGLGFGLNTFSIDKALSEIGDQTVFVPITEDFDYSCFQNLYIDIPLEFRYLTPLNEKGKNFGFYLGAKAGYLLNSEKEISVTSGDLTTVTTERNINNMNKIRYGFSGKVSYRKLNTSKDKKNRLGLAYSLHGNYYPSELFESDKGIETQYFSFGIGLSFIFQ